MLARMTPTASTSPQTRETHKGLILGICCMSLFIVSMDATVVNVALPSLGRDLHTTFSGLQWTIDAYTLVIASLLVLSGSMADRFGRRRVFQIGLGVFALGSLLCSLATSVPALVAFRMVQAVGGSMLNPVAMSIITATFIDRAERARAVGVWGAVVGISMGLGPLIGGALTQTVGWPAIFWINLPICLLAIGLTARFVPESKAAKARRFDPWGQGLVITLLATLVGGLIEGPNLGWHSTSTLVLFGTAAAAVALLLLIEPRRQEPLIDLRFFHSLPFSGAVITAICAFGSFGAILFLCTLYLQESRGLTPFQAGLFLLPLAACTTVASPLSGRLVGKRGTRLPLTLAASGLGLAACILLTLSATTPFWLIALALAIFGLGFGMVKAPITTSALSGMPMAQAGSAAGIASTSRQIGVSLGVAVAGSLTGMSASAHVGQDFATATHAMWCATLCLAGLILSLAYASTSALARRSAERVAHLLV